jgi:hypothetical protein
MLLIVPYLRHSESLWRPERRPEGLLYPLNLFPRVKRTSSQVVGCFEFQDSQEPTTAPIHPAANRFVASSKVCGSILWGAQRTKIPNTKIMPLTITCIHTRIFCCAVTTVVPAAVLWVMISLGAAN